jgi:hypothetical protein
LDIDVIYGRNIVGENADWITLGLNVRFDAKKYSSVRPQCCAIVLTGG